MTRLAGWALALLFAAGCAPPVAVVDGGAVADAGHVDAGTADAGGSDAGEVDAGTPDGGSEGDGGTSLCGALGPGWHARAALAGGPRQEHSVVALRGEVVVLGGFNALGQIINTVEAWSPATNTWRALAPLPRPLHHINAAVVDDTLYVLGGLITGFAAVTSSYRYDAMANTWTPVTPMPFGTERGGGGVTVSGGEVLIIGGFRLGSVVEVSAYAPTANTWRALASLPTAKDHLFAGTTTQGVLSVSGRLNGALNGDVHALAADGGSWIPRAGIRTARAGVAGAVFNDVVYVFGGEGDRSRTSGVFPQSERYTVTSNTWSAVSDMRTPRHGMGAAVIDDGILVPGGATVEAFGAVDTVELYCPE